MPGATLMPADGSVRRIFLSSTALDLAEHRKAVAEQIERWQQAPVRMETFGANPGAPVSVCTEKAASADALVVVVAHRYGWVPSPEQGGDGRKSITWFEVEAAKRAKKPVFAFLVDENCAWTQPKEQDRLTDLAVLKDMAKVAEVLSCVEGLQAFKQWLSAEVGITRETFTTPDQLSALVSSSLGTWLLGRPDGAGARPGADALRKQFPLMLRALWQELRPLRLYAATRQESEAAEIPVFSVYTTVDVTEQVSLRGERELEGHGGASGRTPVQPALQTALEADLRCERPERGEPRSDSARPVRALEAAAAFPRLVLVGPPGSGKSTFVQHLAVCLVGELLGDEPRANVNRLRRPPPGGEAWMPWEQQAWLPIFIELRRFVQSSAFPKAGSAAEFGHVFRYLEERAPGRERECEALQRHVAEQRGEGALLILDGLDETPQAESCRERIQAVVHSFVEAFPRARVIVTSRPYAYRAGSPWRLDREGFVEVELAPFSPVQIESFCRHWYAGMAERKLVASEDEASKAQSLWLDLNREPYVMRLADRPLMLTMLADLHTQDGRLPASRARLFEESARLLLNRWNAARETGKPGENRLSGQLGISLDDLQRAVEEVAFDAQRAGDARAEAASLDAGQVIQVLRRHGGQGEAEEILDFLHERSGILVAESGDRYRFPHRSYQEYLAACHLTVQEFPELLCREVSRELDRWREVVPLAVARVAPTPFMAWKLVEALLGARSAPRSEADADARSLRALLCARGLVESGLHERVQEQDRALLERVRAELLEVCEQGRLAVADRADAGDLLGALGDPRIGTPQWKSIPAGVFWMGAQSSGPQARGYDAEAFPDEGPVHRVEVPQYELGRWPVTVGEYDAFVRSGGYAAREHWDADGWTACETQGWSGPEDWSEQLRHPNRPVVGVSWYEAFAYARSCGARLPSEAERERAARGGEGRRYPWGTEFDASHCNTRECRLFRVAPVGIFPGGRSPHGVDDLVGNVWEWVEDDWNENYQGAPGDGSAWVNESRGSDRVIRGGAWGNVAQRARAACRCWYHPGYRLDYLGFRLARGPKG
jgi:formylglycine-generating enzyme required for sulfatase activity